MEELVRRFGPFEFDVSRHRLQRDGADIHLSPKAFALLALLIEAAPRVVSKQELHAQLWPNGVVSDATLVALVKQLRRALDDRDSQARVIRTVHRVGYAFEATLLQTKQDGPLESLVGSSETAGAWRSRAAKTSSVATANRMCSWST